MSKSYVTMESRLCLTCGCEYSTGALLMDKRLREVFERDTVTGWGLCDQHRKAFHDGMVGLVEIDSAKSGSPHDAIQPDDAYRTGRVLLVKRSVLDRMLDEPSDPEQPVVFVDQADVEKMFPPEVLANAPIESERSTVSNITPGPSSIN